MRTSRTHPATQPSALEIPSSGLGGRGLPADTHVVRSIGSSTFVRRLLGAACYLAALLVVLGAGDAWTQLGLVLVSFTAGYVSGRWWAPALATLVVPAVAVTFSRVAYEGDALSWRLDAALFAAFYGVPPMALLIALGVASRRIVQRGLRRVRSGTPAGAGG